MMSQAACEAFLQIKSYLTPVVLTHVSLAEGFCHFCFPGRAFFWSNRDSPGLKYFNGAQKVW